ncbi:MAG TPA: PAS domain S-box protein [Bryobacteraceae bacterium]|nr:PAS domain S-box protein [Bryobacteraceae bacterium]
MRPTETLLLIFAALLLAAIVIVSAQSWSNLQETRAATARTQGLIGDLDAFQALLTDAETGQRGYLLTGNRDYLQPYLDADGIIPGTLDSLQARLDPGTAARLRTLTQAKLGELAHTIRLYTQASPAAAIDEVKTNRGRAEMDEIRTIVDRTVARQNAILRQGDETQDRLANRTLFVASTGSAVLFAFLCLSSFTIGAMADRRESMIAELRESRAQKEEARHTLEVTLKSIGDAVITTDVEGRVLFINTVAERLTGWVAAEAEGRPIQEVFRILDEATHSPMENPVDKVRRVLAITGLANHTLLIRRDGTEIPIDDSGAPILGAGHHLVGVVMVFRDVTDRRRAERLLEESARRYRQLADSMPQIVWTATRDGLVDYGNERWRKRIGLLPGADPGNVWPAVIHPDDLSSFESAWNETRSQGEAFQVECRVRNVQTGRYRWYLGRAIPVRDETGAPEKWFGTFTDIDERKQSESALRQANEDLSQFAYSASHDLQEPLRNVIMFTQLFARRNGGRLDADSEEMIRLVVDSAKRMEELMRDLLLYVRAGSMPLAKEAPMTDSQVALDKALSHLHSTIRSADAVIEVQGPLPEVAVDEVHLTQLFQNLIGNSLKYRRAERPNVQVFATLRNAEWVISVRDNGIGIDPQYAKQIFGLFKRLHGAEQYPGTGIGLAICQKILERYDGRIWVDPNIEQGAQLSFAIPATKDTGSDS